jgi:signal transduction histidine kinase
MRIPNDVYRFMLDQVGHLISIFIPAPSVSRERHSMWSNTSTIKLEPSKQSHELVRAATERTVMFVAILAGFALVTISATWPSLYQWNLVPGLSIVAIVALIVYRLLDRAFRVAQIIWQVGLGLAILVLAMTLGQVEILFLLALLPLMAIFALGVRGGLLSQAGVIALVLFASQQTIFPRVSEEHQIAIILAGLLCGLLGWALSSPLVTVMDWYAYAFEKSQANLEQVRQQRTQLNQALNQLDQANQQLQRTNASLVAARRAAEAAERFKTEFVANVSHELRTPLNLIIGFAEVMVTSPESYGGEPLPGAYRSDIYAMYNSAKHLRALVDDVLDLGRLDANKIALVQTQVSVGLLVGQVESMVRDYVNAKGLELQIQIEEDLPLLQIDQLRIRQVLLNLIVNAVRFTEQGFVELRVARQAQQVIFRIQDSGRGIAPEDLPHIFEPFRTTEHRSETGWHAGSGLGVPISKRFVELHGGQMGVESHLYQGTVFWFTLPCADEPKSLVLPTSENFPTQELGEPERRVAVVERDETTLASLQRQIAAWKFIAVKTFEEGIELANQDQVMALITDELPQTIPQIRLPVIQVPLPSRTRIATTLGARDLLFKPVTTEKLYAALDQLDQPIRRVLLAVNDPGLIRLFRRILRPRIAMPNCLEAYTSDEVLARIVADQPDAILLDANLPQLRVREFLARPECKSVPVILLGEDWDEWGNLPYPIQVFRTGGFRTGELLRTTQAILDALANSTAPAHSQAIAE